MAFEDGLGTDPAQPRSENFTLDAYGLVSTTINLWIKRLMQYILLAGLISAASIAISLVIVFGLIGSLGTIGSDPFSAIVSLFFDWPENLLFVGVSITFAVIAFIINAIVYGGVIKFTLDEYGGPGGDIGRSLSHSVGRVVQFIIVQMITLLVAAVVFVPSIALSSQALSMIDLVTYNIPPEAFQLMMMSLVIMGVGGIILLYISVRFAAALVLVIDTDLSAIDALKRSWQLTSGQFLHIFGSIILINVAILLIGMGITIVVGFLPFPLDYLLVVDAIITAFMYSYLVQIFNAVLYRDLASRSDVSDLPGFVW